MLTFSTAINTAGVSALVTAAISAALCWLLIRFSDGLPFQNAPVRERWHCTSTPDSGGIAIFVAAAFGWILALPGSYAAVACGAALVLILGLIDDRLRFRARSKLIAQLIIATGTVLAGISFDIVLWRPANVVLTVLWIVGITNALNLIDNMDGLAAGVAIIIAVFMAALLILHGHLQEGVLCGVLAGATGGFLIFNLHPAKIFMGNGGSMFVGFCLAALAVATPVPHAEGVFAVCFYLALTFAYPIFDTALVTVLRFAAKRPIWVGGRDHSSHRLASIGLDERGIAIGIWTLTAATAMMGLFLHGFPLAAAAIVALAVVFTSLFGLFLGCLPAYPLPPQRPAGRPRVMHQWLFSLLIDGAFAGIVVACAFLLRFDLVLSPVQLHHLMLSIPVAVTAHLFVCILNRTYRASWTYFDIFDALRVLRASAASGAIGWTCLALFLPEYSGALAALYFILLAGIELSARSFLRGLRSLLIRAEPVGRRVAIFGADPEGEALVRYLRCSKCLPVVPVVFVDSRPELEGIRVARLPVRGISGSLHALRNEFAVEAVVLPAEWSGREDLSHIRDRIQRAGLDVCSLDISVRPAKSVAGFNS